MKCMLYAVYASVFIQSTLLNIITGTEEFRVLDLKPKKTPVRRKHRRKQEVMPPR
jgi:hypothetical protein